MHILNNIYIYIYIHACIHTYIIYIYIYSDSLRNRSSKEQQLREKKKKILKIYMKGFTVRFDKFSVFAEQVFISLKKRKKKKSYRSQTFKSLYIDNQFLFFCWYWASFMKHEQNESLCKSSVKLFWHKFSDSWKCSYFQNVKLVGTKEMYTCSTCKWCVKRSVFFLANWWHCILMHCHHIL